MCTHQIPCPAADATDREAARIVGHDPLGFNTLCNGVIVFEDTGDLLPTGEIIAPHRGPALHSLAS